MLSQRPHRPVKRGLCALLPSVAAGYLWAVIFGDGIHGLKSVSALNNSNSFPDANAAFLAALFVYAAGPFLAAWLSGLLLARGALLKWLAATAVAGAALFGLSRLLV